PSTGGKHYSITDPLYAVLDMPALSPTMSQGNIAKWRKKEGHKELVINFIVVLVKVITKSCKATQISSSDTRRWFK
ncbi:hypothetical protein ABKV19_016619, partial [Rosa sericea]